MTTQHLPNLVVVPEFSTGDTETWMLILSRSWGCTLVLGTGNWVQKKWQCKATYNTGFNLRCLFKSSDPSVSFLILFAFPGDTGTECPPSRLRVPRLFPGLLPGTLAGSLPASPGRCCARSRVPDWRMEVPRPRVGCRNQLSRFECCSLTPCACVFTDKVMKIQLWL